MCNIPFVTSPCVGLLTIYFVCNYFVWYEEFMFFFYWFRHTIHAYSHFMLQKYSLVYIKFIDLRHKSQGIWEVVATRMWMYFNRQVPNGISCKWNNTNFTYLHFNINLVDGYSCYCRYYKFKYLLFPVINKNKPWSLTL